MMLKIASGPPRKAPTTEVEYLGHGRKKWGLDPDIDRDTRKVCESS